MITVSEHQAAVAALLPRLPAVRLPLAQCLGSVIAERVRAPVSLPPFDNSAMDGYAVRAVDVAQAPVTLEVTEDIPAGRTDTPELRPGTAHRIMTGAPMPQGADAVVKVEDTDAGMSTVRVDVAVPRGNHLRRAGEDVTAGMQVLAEGTEVTASIIGLLAALGLPEVTVYRKPRVQVISTGSELVAAGVELRPGQIYESNGAMLAAAVRAAGAEAVPVHAVADDEDAFLALLREDVDLIITSGGVSAGAYEVVKDALASRGVTFGKVAMQPGGPQGCGRYRGVPVVTLPGNPVSSLVSFEVFVRPVLRAAFGSPTPQRPQVSGIAVEDLTGVAGKRQFRRGFFDADTGEVEIVGGPGSHLLSSLAVANCLVIVEGEVRAGQLLTCLMLS